MAAIGLPITADMFNTVIQKKIAKVGIMVDDPFKSIYQDFKSNAQTVNLPFSLPVGGLQPVGNTSGKGIYGAPASGNVSWNDFRVTRQPYSRVFPVNRLIATSDQAGVYADLPEKITRAAQSLLPYLTTQMLVLGFTTTLSDIDGLSFFNASHSLIGGATINNTTTAAFSEASYTIAKQSLNSYYVIPDEHSGPQILNPTSKRVLMVGPTQEVLAKKVIDRQKGTFGEDLVLYKDADIVVNRFLTGAYANYWFLFAVGGESKSVLKWESEPMKLLFFNEKNSAECAENMNWKYVVTWVGAPHLLYFHTVYGSTGAAAYVPPTSIPITAVS